MLTIKTTGYSPKDDSVFIGTEIYSADHVAPRYDAGGILRGIVLSTSGANSVSGNAFERVIYMDANGHEGPATVFVENSGGHTVQRYSAEQKT